ncbi:MAG: tail fiber domain-containing protein [Bacteroidales bacterium]
MHLPVGTNFGLIAQEVEPVLPEIVKEIHHPAQYDSLGNEISPALDFKALTYNSLIPIAISAIQEIDDTIREIVAKPDIPILIAPENNDTILAKEIPEFVWHKANHAQFYTLYLSYTSDMSDVFQSVTRVDTISNEYIKTNNDTTIYWAVKAFNTFGESDYSEIRHVFCAYGFDKKKAQSYSKLSDANLKNNINDINDALQKTMQLNGVSFEWDTEQNPDRNLEPGTNFGIIAQEIQLIFPEVVKTDENGFLYIDYTSLVPVLVEALKEQQTQINHLQQQMNDLASVVDDCCGDSDKGANNDDSGENNNKPEFSQNIELNNQQAIVLNQNVPNPFKEQTTIRFQVPETVKEARLVFIDNTGTVLKQVEIHERGTGELIVYAQDLSAGMYSYYLVADGKTIASKKMVVSGK